MANPVNRKAFWEWEKAMFDRMRTGKYAPVLTGTDKGLRLDIVSADVVMVGNKPKIRFPLVLWGAQRETREDERSGVKRVLTWAEFATTFRLLDDKGKLYGEMSTGNPGMRNDFPERLIAEVPPQTVPRGHQRPVQLEAAGAGRLEAQGGRGLGRRDGDHAERGGDRPRGGRPQGAEGKG